MSSSPFPALPVCQVSFPSGPLFNKAYAYAKEHVSIATLNHCLRGTAFALLISRKFPPLAAAGEHLDVEAIALSTLLHDLGWATTKSLLSADKRFEVDGANLARSFIQTSSPKQEDWDKHRLQLLWDAIALHTTPSIATHKEPEVAATQLGIAADFFGPNLPLPGNVITVEEYREIVNAFPREGFKDELVQIMCGLCRDKKETTFDNFVCAFGLADGLDGKGGGREEFRKDFENSNIRNLLLGGLAACEEYEK